jgi:hypothetical protein
MSDEKYDVVIDVLTKHREKLWKMTQGNMNAGAFNIMDTIRLGQIDDIDSCIKMWTDYNERTDDTTV